MGSSPSPLKLPARLRQLRRAIAIFGKKPDVFHAIGLGECGLLAGIAGKLLRVPMLASVFSGELIYLPHINYGLQGDWRMRTAVALTMRLAQGVTACSDYSLNEVPAWVKCRHFLPFSVPPMLYQTGEFAAPSPPPWKLLHVGHLNAVKNQRLLLEAIKIVAQELPVHLDWFGGGITPPAIPEMITSLEMEHLVHFHGMVTNAQLRPFFNQAHLYVQSSWYENHGVAVLEAAAAGLPIVGTDVGLVADWKGKRAIATPVDDVTALANAIKTMLTSANKRQQLGTAAQAWAQQYDAAWTAQRCEELYKSML